MSDISADAEIVDFSYVYANARHINNVARETLLIRGGCPGAVRMLSQHAGSATCISNGTNSEESGSWCRAITTRRIEETSRVDDIEIPQSAKGNDCRE